MSDAGADDDYVSKPLQSEHLFAAMERFAPPAEHVGNAMAAMAARDEGDAVFDGAALRDAVDGDEQLVRELLTIFLDERPILIGRIRDAVARRDSGALESAAHALKGSAGSVRAPRVTATALALESMGRAGDVNGAEATLATLEEQMAELSQMFVDITAAASASNVTSEMEKMATRAARVNPRNHDSR